MESSWKGYLEALGKNKAPKSNIDTAAFPTTEGNNVSSGFIEWKTPNKEQQARYDAMSGSWKGIKASESAVASGIYKTEYMPVSK
jgi:hypothetical protein